MARNREEQLPCSEEVRQTREVASPAASVASNAQWGGDEEVLEGAWPFFGQLTQADNPKTLLMPSQPSPALCWLASLQVWSIAGSLAGHTGIVYLVLWRDP